MSCPEGLEALHSVYPSVYIYVCVVCAYTMIIPINFKKMRNCFELMIDIHVVTAAVDEGLNADKYIIPGLGDFGDRFYNSV